MRRDKDSNRGRLIFVDKKPLKNNKLIDFSALGAAP